MAVPFKVQISMQGGGAKIAVLVAAAQAVQELEQIDRAIIVTQIAGTSAGAIVGAFLAGDKKISNLRTKLVGGFGKELLCRFSAPNQLMGIWKAWKGSPFWEDAHLKKWFDEEFKDGFNGLKKKLIVVSANIDERKATKHRAPGGHLSTALLESMGLPFCFRTWNSGGHTINVDGGLCENLPVDDLLADAGTDGRVVAFSFPQAQSDRPTNLWTFGMSLLDVAINHSVHTARARLGAESVCTLRGPEALTTFNFEAAMNFLESDKEYNDTVEFVKKWFRNLISSSATPKGVHFSTDPWNGSEDSDFFRQMKTVGRIYRDQHESKKFHYREIKLVARINALAEADERGFGEPDEVFYEFTFEPADHPVSAIALTLSSPIGSDFFGKYEAKLLDPQGRRISPTELASKSSIDYILSERP